MNATRSWKTVAIMEGIARTDLNAEEQMDKPRGINRVILVVLDGLRADAISTLRLPTLSALAARGSHSYHAQTVEPSITAAALTSLFTGVPPVIHRIRSDRFGLPRATEVLTSLPRVLRANGIPTAAFLASLPAPFRGLAERIVEHAGASAKFIGKTSEQILDSARHSLTNTTNGLIFLHWSDADIAGHEHGWMSAAYARAARQLDESMERLVRMTGVVADPETVLIVVADHGGGGDNVCNHNSAHPFDRTIPLIIVGGRVARIELQPGLSLLDIPSTVAWLLGVAPPERYFGRILHEVLEPGPVALPPRPSYAPFEAA